MNTPAVALYPLISIINWLISAYTLVLLARVIFSWIRLPSQHPVMRTVGPVIYGLTEPLLKPIRRLLAPYQRNSPLDFSVLILWLIIELVRRLLIRLVA
ncbi:MAG: YggT family protein [Armatimonadota bacterium]